MDYRALFKGDYISAVEFAGKHPTMTIESVKLVPIADEKTGRDKDKGVVFFRETDRGWVLNKTNAQCIAAMFGADTDGWLGKRVTLHAQEVRFGNERVPGIRVLGSPDIPGPIRAEVKLPRRKPVYMTMEVTGRRGRAPESNPSAPTPEEREEQAGEAQN